MKQRKSRIPGVLATGLLISLTAHADEQALHGIAAAPSAERIQRDIEMLVSFGTRHTLSETESDTHGIGAARRWIKAEFEKISADCGGCLEVFYVSDVVSGTTRIPDPVDVVNVVAIQRGSQEPNRFVMMSGDIDTRVSDPMNYSDDAPGANDNATARVFSEGTRFVETDDETRQRRFQGGEVDSASRNMARYIDRMADLYIPNLDMMMVYRLDRFGRGGHHRPFNEVGFPAVRIMETNENYNWQHQDIRVEDGIAYGDVIEHVDFDYAAKLTALAAVTLASMAWAPAPPEDVSISGQAS